MDRNRRLINDDERERRRIVDAGDGLADSDAFNAGNGHDVAHRGLFDLGALEPRKGKQLGDARFVERTVTARDVCFVACVQRSLKDAADGDAAEVIGVIEVRNQNLQRAAGITRRFRDRFHDGAEERLQIDAGLGWIGRRCAGLGDGVQDRKVQLGFVRVEVDEQIVDFVQHFLRARIGPIDFVNDHDGRQLGLERF